MTTLLRERQTPTYVAGDVVQMRSGGPEMTVVGIGLGLNLDKVRCRWFDRNLALQEADFAEFELAARKQP